MTGHAQTRTRVRRLPRVVEVGAGTLAELPGTLLRAGFPLERVLVVCGGETTERWARQVADRLTGVSDWVDIRRAGAGSCADAERVGAVARELDVDLLVAVGGGRAIDVAKIAALSCEVDVVVVPTAVSHDGISSPVTSLLNAAGERNSQPGAVPAAVIIDTELVAAAPARLLIAGAGDLLSNLSATEDWRLADRRGLESFDAYAALIADGAAQPLLRLERLSTPAGVETLAKGLILSGLAMVTAGTSRPCSGAEHLISHSLDALLGGRARLHGEQVALGMLVTAAARGLPEQAEALRSAFGRLGLPLQPADVGLSMDVMAQAVRTARATRPGRYTVLDEIDLGSAAVFDLLERAFLQ